METKKKKKKQKKKRFKFANIKKIPQIIVDKILIVLIILTSLFYIGANIYTDVGSSRIKTTIIDIGEVRNTVDKDLVIIRDEMVFNAPAQGYYELIYPEGERVKKGTAIAKTKNQNTTDNYRYLLELIDARIKSIENNIEMVISENELNKVNNRLEYLYKEIQNRLSLGELSYIDSLKKEIQTLNNKKQYLLKEDEGEGKTVEELKIEKAEIENILKTQNSIVYSNYIGILSPFYDGYEDKLNFTELKNLSVSDIIGIKDSPPIDYNEKKSKGEALGRIVNNNKWYFACEVTKEDIEYIQTEKPVNIIIEDKIVKAYLEDFHKGSDDKYLGYFRVENENFIFYENRLYSGEIEYQYEKGLKIPLSALTYRDQTMGVYIVDRTGNAVFKKVDRIACKNEEYFAITYEATYTRNPEKINLYDEVIVNPEGVKEGQKVK